jgi:hypothetical protein
MQRPDFRQLAVLLRERAASFALAVAAGALLVWACYWFSYGVVPAWHTALPAPEFFDGIAVAAQHNTVGHNSYLLGVSGTQGWWYYFPVTLAVKTPIALLILLLLGIASCWRFRANPGYWLPLTFSLGTLFTGMAGHVNIGVRHILPVYVGFSIVAGAAVSNLMRRGAARGGFAAALLLWMAASGGLQHPDYISYFNEFIRAEPEKVLVDSDLDWGQDLKRLSRRLHELGVTRIAMETFGPPSLPSLYDLPPAEPVYPFFPTQVWTVIHPTIAYTLDRTNGNMAGTDYASIASAAQAKPPWFLQTDPSERVGALLLFKTPPEKLAALSPGSQAALQKDRDPSQH